MKGCIALVKAKNQYMLTSTFMRAQEYYESPYEEIRNNFFTIEEYQDVYANHKGNFTYYTDWNGFNIPGKKYREYVNKFKKDFTKKERNLFNLISKINQNNLYIIGIHPKTNALEHEFAHALYYIDKEYREKQNRNIEEIDRKELNRIYKKLEKMGYTKEVYNDEVQAYLSTKSDKLEIQDKRITKPFKKEFKEYRYSRIKQKRDLPYEEEGLALFVLMVK